MDDDAKEPQDRRLAGAMADALKVIDEGLSLHEVSMPERPFRATCDLLQDGFVKVEAGEVINVDRLWDYIAEPWFRAIYTGVETWYRDRYGVEALVADGNPPLLGVVLFKGAPFLVQVPMHRNVIEVEGKTAWMYFEAGLGEGEDPRRWLARGPKLDALAADETQDLDGDLHHVATSLRSVQHHLLGGGQDEAQRGLRQSIRSYLETAARRICTQNAEEFALAWMDLQMAAEAALKIVIVRSMGGHPYWHELVDLLAHPGAGLVRFDPARLDSWPTFADISNRRYGKGYRAGLTPLLDAYRLILDLVVACVRTIDPPLPSGAGILVHVSPWLVDDPLLPRRGSTGATPNAAGSAD